MNFRFGLPTLFLLVMIVSCFCWLATNEVFVVRSETHLTMTNQGGITKIIPKQVVERRLHPSVILIGLGVSATMLLMAFDSIRRRRQAKAEVNKTT